MKKYFLLYLVLLFIPTVNAQRGCCSHHGGVAGCSSSGRQICNDGTYSPSCTCTPAYVYGCTDSNAKNYNSNANKDNGSCIYYKYGCTNPDAKNYDSTAEKDDGSCVLYKYGCMDSSAINYDPTAEKDNGECNYEIKNAESLSSNDEDDISSEDAAGSVTAIGTLGAIGYIIYKKKKKNN